MSFTNLAILLGVLTVYTLTIRIMGHLEIPFDFFDKLVVITIFVIISIAILKEKVFDDSDSPNTKKKEKKK